MGNDKESSYPGGIYEEGISEFDKKGVIIANIMIILWLIVGIFAVWIFYPPAGIVYGLFIAVMFMFVMRKALCTKCYYYGKRCSMGWGLYTAKLFKKGDVNTFKGCAGSKFAPFLWMTVSFLPVVLLVISTYFSFSIFKAVFIVILILLIIIIAGTKNREKACQVCKMRYLCAGSAAKDKD